ncbi:MAG: hypothetical protein ACREKL_00135, partial [Chthoniobacterales bacterium]
MKKRITLAAAITVLTLSQAFADSATLTLDAAYLKTALGVKIPENTGLLMLVASRMDALFGTPTSAAFTTDDDVELGRWALTGGGADGTFSQTIVLDLTGNLTTGDPVELLWFPSLNVASSQP